MTRPPNNSKTPDSSKTPSAASISETRGSIDTPSGVEVLDIDVALDALRAAGGPDSSDDALASVIAACGRVRSWVAAVEARAVSEVRRRQGDAIGVLADTQRASRRRAAATLERAKLVESVPGLEDALASGAVTADHADAFANIAAGHREALATQAPELLAEASTVDADGFRQRLRGWQAERDRQAGTSELERQRRRRCGSVTTRADDGMGIFHFELDALAAARTRAALAKRAEALWRVDNAGPPSERRTPRQRLADAFEELVCESGTGDVATSIMIVADLDTLMHGLPGRCELLDGTPMPVDEVRELALSARLLPAIFDRQGQPLWVGRSARLPNAAQRAVIAIRDRGCRVPGCDAPIEWCQIHHIIWWSNDGLTDLDNLITVCSAHHHKIHDDGWHLGLTTNGSVTWRGPPNTT